MTKLDIARLINTLAGTQGSVDTTENTSGYQTTIITFLDQAYNDVQLYRLNQWKFMKGQVSVPLSTTVDTFSSTDVAEVTRVIYNKQVLKEVPYEDWVLTDHATGKPTEFTVDPYNDNAIVFNPSDINYIVTLQYQKVPDVLSSNSAVPILPTRFHNVIAFKALIGLGSYLGNDDLITKYTSQYSIEMGQLMRSQVPRQYVTTSPLV